MRFTSGGILKRTENPLPHGTMTKSEEGPKSLGDFLSPIQKEQSQMLSLVDKLQGASLTDIDIPQIVVVGEQSAGKSSVLEAISGIPFPRAAGACTKFATEIRLRPSATPDLKVEIIPDPNTKGTQSLEKLRQFEDNISANTPLVELFKKANELLTSIDRFAARDILVIEKFGPDLPLLTLVDLPGLIRNPNNDQTRSDMAAIEAITDDFMTRPRSLIMAVVGGNTDYAQAIVLEKARQHDPQGCRTIGVLTKPDCTFQIGLEGKFLNLVMNRDRENRMLLGWYVVLNPGPNITWTSRTTRAEKEKTFFSRKPWSEVPPDRRGAVVLRRKLNQQLLEHVAQSIPSLRSEVSTLLESCQKELASVGYGWGSGGARDEVKDMRKDILGLIEKSRRLVDKAVSGDYKNSFFPHQSDPKGIPAQNLRARVVDANTKFAESLRLHGRSWSFDLSSFEQDVIHVDAKDYAATEVASLIEQSKGEHLEGDTNHRTPYWVFEKNSTGWNDLAKDHVNRISEICNEFLAAVLQAVWPGQMHEPLRHLFLNTSITRFHDAAGRELESLENERICNIRTYDPDYVVRKDKWHNEHKGCTRSELVLYESLIVFDILVKIYTRNVIVQVIERHFMKGMGHMFDVVGFSDMNDNDVKTITAESPEVVERRAKLKKQKQDLTDALTIIQTLHIQPSSGQSQGAGRKLANGTETHTRTGSSSDNGTDSKDSDDASSTTQETEILTEALSAQVG